MASKHSYTITLNNNLTEKEGIDYLLKLNKDFVNPDLKGKKAILKHLKIDKRFSRAFDLLIIPGHNFKENSIDVTNNQITLVELKTTQKPHKNNPSGFFFGATKNEFDLAKKLGPKYKFCFVSLHPETKSYALLTLKQLEDRIKTKRIQYQINLK